MLRFSPPTFIVCKPERAANGPRVRPLKWPLHRKVAGPEVEAACGAPLEDHVDHRDLSHKDNRENIVRISKIRRRI